MIARIQARYYRCLRYIDQELKSFQLLVGANATGKTSFLDAVAFLGDLISSGVETAVRNRTPVPQDLTWMRDKDGFELAIEAAIPDELRNRLEISSFSHVRYEVGIDMDVMNEGVGIVAERVWLRKNATEEVRQIELFPELKQHAASILLPKRRSKGEQQLIVSRVAGGNDNYMAETGKGYSPSFKQSPKRSALGNLPADEENFPVSTWLKSFMTRGIQNIVLDNKLIRKASPPCQEESFKTDGSNLPWVIDHVGRTEPVRIRDWVRHVRTALPDLTDICSVGRDDDKHRYLTLRYANGLEVPSWLTSDGTLRLLALTLPAYLPEFRGTYVIEEPESGI